VMVVQRHNETIEVAFTFYKTRQSPPLLMHIYVDRSVASVSC
jgi:hypothetical protein